MDGRRFCGRVLALTLVCAWAGCAGSAKPIKTEGIVTLDGKPVESATVTFVPEAGGPSASGITGTDGTFRLTTRNTGDGALPGDYKVTIAKTATDTSLTQVVTSDDPTQALKQQYGAFLKSPASKGTRGQKSSLPANYGNLEKTPLKYTIPADRGRVEIQLKSSGS